VNVRCLDRKKTHLHKCVPYNLWRAAGNGEELQPSLTYGHKPRRPRISGENVENRDE
jgi:hypothetical protein